MRGIFYGKSIIISVLCVLLCCFITSCEKTGFDEDDNEYVDEEPTQDELEETLNHNFHELDWENTTVFSADTTTNTYKIQLNEQTKTIKPGNIITLKDGINYYIIIVDTAIINADNVEIKGTQGDLCDIFANTDLSMSTVRNNRSSDACTPMLIEYVDANNCVHSYKVSRTADEKTTLTGNLWHYDLKGLNESETNFIKDTNVKYGFRQNNMSLDIDLILNVNFGGRSKIQMINSLRKRLRSKILSVNAELRGTVNSYMKLFAQISGQAEYDKGEELIKHNLLRPIYVTFSGPYGIPIQVVLSAELFRTATIEASGEIELSMGYDSKFLLSAGLSWNQESGQISPYGNCDLNSEFIPPTLSGKGEIKAKASIYPRIFIMLYNTLGISFDIAPYVAAELSAGFSKAITNSKSDYLAWNVLGKMGLDCRNAVSVKMLNYEIEHYNLNEYNIIEGLLFEAPYDINLMTYSPHYIESGKKTNFTFEVSDQNYILNQSYPTVFPAIVNFKSNGGSISKKYDFCNNGQVSVDWTPASDEDVLTAFLCDKDGQIIAQTSVDANGNEENDDNGSSQKLPKPSNELEVDLGLSVNWSGWNLGANSAEYPGGYYAYGETTPRTNFLNSNYEFYQPIHNHPNGECCELDYVDIGSITGTKYDAATKQLGSKWHIPTTNECRELHDNCDFFEYKFHGMDGVLVVSLKNNKAIFIPKAGWYWSGWGNDESAEFDAGTVELWTSTFVRGYWPCAFGMKISEYNGITIDTFNRTCGFPIRPVKAR